MQAKAKNAELEAERLLKKLNMQTYFDMPVDLDKVAKHLGVEVVYADFATMTGAGVDPEASGFLFFPQNAIAINTKHSALRQRFTLAHELGHYVLHKGKLANDRDIVYRDEISTLGTDPLEIEANSFAAALLMPEELFDTVSTLYNDDYRVARFFGVSSQAMKIRNDVILRRNRSRQL